MRNGKGGLDRGAYGETSIVESELILAGTWQDPSTFTLGVSTAV